MYRLRAFLPLILTGAMSCSPTPAPREQAISEIRKAEKDFEAMVADKGSAEGFGFFADSSAVINRGGVVQGKDAIRAFYSADRFKSAKVSWAPDFVDASSAGDIGYTYGKFKWVSTDSTGKATEISGIFHTVWRKQKDGTWKYVWD